MATIHDLLRDTEEQLRVARRDAKFAREDLKDAPKDRRLRIAADDAEARASELGRQLVEVRFIRDLDDWSDRHSRFEIVPDELLVAAAPRVRGFQTTELIPDWEWVGAMSLKRAGLAVPSGWTSYEGNPLPNDSVKSDPRAAA